jgi:quercetin dioxygenase-like cupin family protein
LRSGGKVSLSRPIRVSGLRAQNDIHLPLINYRFLTQQQETPMSGTAKAIKHIENDKVIVTEYRFAPGANTGWHRHGHDYVVVPLMDGRVKLLTKQGENFAEMKKGMPYFRNEGVEHDVINANDGEYAFIEIELK